MLNLKRNVLAGLLLSGSVAVAMAASSLEKTGVEYPIIHSLIRDQVLPHLSLGANGGYIVAQDPIVDGNGSGIRARRIYSDLSAFRTSIQVNSITAGDQQNAKVAVLPQGGAVFAWQGSTAKGHRVYVRFLGGNDTFSGPEFPASEVMVGHQANPALALLTDGTVVVVWSEENRDGSMQGIFGQRFTSAGTRVGGTFQVNSVTHLNQRSPAIAPLVNGGFVVAWVSDEFRQRGGDSIDIAGRIFGSNGSPIGSDFALNTKNDICANPVLAQTPSGFRAAWSSRFVARPTLVGSSNEVVLVNGVRVTNTISVVTATTPSSDKSWDVSTRLFDFTGASADSEVVVNATLKGNQYSPRLLNFRNRELVLWTSYGQDGSDEGIYGRVVTGIQFEANEFRVNNTTIYKQVFPTVAALGDKVVVAWATFASASAGFDIVAQQFTMSGDDALLAPAAPFASAIDQKSISVAWAEIGAQPVAAYRIHLDSEPNPIETTAGLITLARDHWLSGSTHTVRLSYRLQDGRVSPLSEAVSVTTWGEDANADGIPDEWQRENWGKVWPGATVDSDGDGASNLAEFLAGTDPTDGNSVLAVQISPREQGLYVQWRTSPGAYYQVQVTSDFQTWANVGASRFAPSTMDSVPMESAGTIRYYRVIRMR
ncbi:MAG TPA: thrombospondin type 3 repeat-containing protein [Verrucomicrobiae bacterium]